MKRKRYLMTLAQLEVLLAVSEHRSFSEAALQLEMSQSAVSSAIASLESALGVTLFSRGRHGALLTPIGARVVSHAQQMIQVQEAIEQEVKLARSLQAGEVRISAFRSVLTHLLPSAIARFRQRFPDVTVSIAEHLDNESIQDDLLKGRADVAFIEEPLSDDLETWDLLKDEYVVLLPPGVLLKNQRLDWQRLSACPLIMAVDGDECDRQVLAHCAAFGQSLHIAYQVRTDSTIVSMVAQGLGATVIPRLAAEPIPSAVQVHSLPVPLFRTIRVAVLAHALHLPPVFAFVELLKDAHWLNQFTGVGSPKGYPR